MELTTKIALTERQQQAMQLLDDTQHDKILLLGGSGSGKSFVEAYKVVRDALRHKAPCLIARDKLVDLTQGMVEQIIPAILQLIAEANGHVGRWEDWTIDGLKFAVWRDKRSRLDFCSGGYVRFAGLSKRDLSESGSDKILSPSWLHVALEEVSELDYKTVELLITRLRANVQGVVNKLILTENPPSINHWTYRRFYDHKNEDDQQLGILELQQQVAFEMQPRDNVENLGETYLRNLSQMTGANRERFYEGKFQDSEEGEIFKRIRWTDNLPSPSQWDALVIYTDPTPLTGKEHSVTADYKASVLLGLFVGETYVLDVRLVRGSTTDMLSNIKQLWDASPNQSITEILIEKKQVPSDFNQVLANFSAATKCYLGVKWDTRKFTDKKASIETFLQPLFEADKIFFNAAFRNTSRGKQTDFQILKFSRKANKMVHDDIPDAIFRGDTYMRKISEQRRKHQRDGTIVTLVDAGYVQRSKINPMN